MEQELNENQLAIRRWVLDNPRKKENDVVKAMIEIGQCSRMTTLKEIKELKKRQILEDVRPKLNNFSCLVVRDKNEFSKINQIIIKIKKMVEAMDEPVEQVFLQGDEYASSTVDDAAQVQVEATRGAQSLPLQVLQYQIDMGYRQRYSLMLQILWDRTDSTIQSEKDKQILHTMIVDLIMKMNAQYWRHRPLPETFKILAFKQGVLKLALSKKIGITKELIDKLNATPEDFARIFELS